jgi:cytidyltransferase-like protein
LTNKTVLFPGRFQPFHGGHAAIIRQLEAEGNTVFVGVRTSDTTTDPWSWIQVQEHIRTVFPLINVLRLPPFDEIVHGRDPGWSMREIEVKEPISATALRQGAIIWITGQSGSGKTTTVEALKKLYLPSAVILDGDDMRRTISDEGFTMDERVDHNLRVARLAKLLRDQGHIVLVSVIAPYRDTRARISQDINPVWIYMVGESKEARKKAWPYEAPIPTDGYIHIDKDQGINKDPLWAVTSAWAAISNQLQLTG